MFKRHISITSCLYSIPKKNKLPPRPKWLIKEDEIKEKFLKGGSGPGGQKINKCNSKVQLTHIPTGIVVTCQATRSQQQNRDKARELLALKLDDLYNAENSRNNIIHDRQLKLKQSKAKKANRKYKKLEEEKDTPSTPEEVIMDPDQEFDEFIKSAKVDV
ncbi:unnamed protein product [Candida verbasci]|uniref:Prokaryotic-type class I peptide chain release factors domain-containing protein n=1 Tax=Candida verbasci TaxID=1227364 RepID=A0A9W4XGC6_9ASCO|nr:unnamed protein product [Candida verbasci]